MDSTLQLTGAQTIYYVLMGYFYALSLPSPTPGQFDDCFFLNLGTHASGLLGSCSLSCYSLNHNSVVYNVVSLGNYRQKSITFNIYLFLCLLKFNDERKNIIERKNGAIFSYLHRPRGLILHVHYNVFLGKKKKDRMQKRMG